MDPLFLHTPFMQMQTHHLNGCSTKISTSATYFNGSAEELDDSMNVIPPLANSFTELNINGSPQARTDVRSGTRYFPTVMPFVPADDLPSFTPSILTVPFDTRTSKQSHLSNVFSENNDKNIVSPATHTMASITSSNFIPNSLKNDVTNVDLKALDSIPTFIPAREKHKTSSTKIQDLSVTVPEFVPRKNVKNGSEALFVNESADVASVNLLNSNSAYMQSGSDVNVENNLARSKITTYQENVNGTTYFYAAPILPISPTVGAGTPITPQTSITIPITSTSQYASPPHFTRHVSAPFKQMPPNTRAVPYFVPTVPTEGLVFNSPIFQSLPEKVACYINLALLETVSGLPSNSLPACIATMYKAIQCESGHPYCLRRIHDTSLPSVKCSTVVGMWKKLNHTNIVKLIDMFATTEFGDNSLVFVYEYYENSETILTKYFHSQTESLNGYLDTFSSDPNAPRPYSHTKNALLRQQHSNVRLPEKTLWSYAIQLIGALKVIHAAGLSCRCIDPTKIVVTDQDRVRIGGTGISDIVLYDHCVTNRVSISSHFQQEDLSALGKLLLALACGSLFAIHRENMETSLEVMSRTYSNDLKNLIEYLLTRTTKKRTISELMPLVGSRFYKQIDMTQSRYDSLRNEISKEANSKKLLRLVIKLSIINQRLSGNNVVPGSHNRAANPLTLFGEYLYKQVTEDDRPCFSMPRIIQCLNKLDAGSSEKICLTTKNGGAPMIMSYEEIKRCFDTAFADLSYSAVYIDEETDSVEVPVKKA